MQKIDLKDVCFFDCETTGVPAKGLKWDADFEFHDPNPVTEPIGTGEPAPEPIPEPERPAVPSRELFDENEF